MSSADTPPLAGADPALERFAALVRTALGVPGARVDLRPGNLQDQELAGYASAPLTDADGRVIGHLRAFDSVPRQWSDAELRLLADLAAACSETLRLRAANRLLEQRQGRAAAQGVSADAAFDRSQLLLRASVALAATGTAEDVVDVVRDLVTSTLNPAYVGISMLDADGRVSLQSGRSLPPGVAARWDLYDSAATTPSALATRGGVPVLLPDMAAVRALAPDAAGTFVEMGWQSAASVPLPGPGSPVGALTFVWKQPYVLDAAEQAILAALAGYVAQALRRADYLSSRENAARVLQTALLPDLPDVAPFELAARYEPASRGEHVGGDWYDAVTVDEDRLAVVVGDVTGHDMRAAARMGRLRSKLRLLLVDRHESPAAVLHRLDTAGQALRDLITATAVLAYLQPGPDGAGHVLNWSNAGHPHPLLITAAGAVPLGGRDPLLGLRAARRRTDHGRHLPPGSTVLFYTDGLIETRGASLDDRERLLWETAAARAGAPLPDLLDHLYAVLAGDDHEDDVAMIAIRTPPATRRSSGSDRGE
ncbi:GAF domain-containing SpoIIE family protein phosphatase [Actinoplanes sp. NPDC023714]|uniref:PP2C family protein-serine/threonine phosphatase n=1 Tax=Actinoplanes sp. NPDC023714 TaxID=3154322 RepID=UPI003400CE4F